MRRQHRSSVPVAALSSARVPGRADRSATSQTASTVSSLEQRARPASADRSGRRRRLRPASGSHDRSSHVVVGRRCAPCRFSDRYGVPASCRTASRCILGAARLGDRDAPIRRSVDERSAGTSWSTSATVTRRAPVWPTVDHRSSPSSASRARTSSPSGASGSAIGDQQSPLSRTRTRDRPASDAARFGVTIARCSADERPSPGRATSASTDHRGIAATVEIGCAVNPIDRSEAADHARQTRHERPPCSCIDVQNGVVDGRPRPRRRRRQHRRRSSTRRARRTCRWSGCSTSDDELPLRQRRAGGIVPELDPADDEPLVDEELRRLRSRTPTLEAVLAEPRRRPAGRRPAPRPTPASARTPARRVRARLRHHRWSATPTPPRTSPSAARRRPTR